MENWIKKIIEFMRNAMNEGLFIDAYKNTSFEEEDSTLYNFDVEYKVNISFCVYDNSLRITTEHGYIKVAYELSKRDKLELDALILSIEEYKEDIAISEFNSFFKKDETPTTIDNLDDDD